MRGKATAASERCCVMGITPAHAGKSESRAGQERHVQDHPRACGEKSSKTTSSNCPPGSPPRMRGKDHLIEEGIGEVRITPAHAGKSRSMRRYRPAPLDHPRACGEKFFVKPRKRSSVGSPPRMRGKGKSAFYHLLLSRITPAHAGKSSVFGGLYAL